MAVTTPTQPLSLEEFLQLPEQKPAYEYINGKPHQKPMPRGKHSLLQTRLSATSKGDKEVISQMGQLFER
ncbi:MAG: Uma2 family endonuclease, partial [Phormidium sp.]